MSESKDKMLSASVKAPEESVDAQAQVQSSIFELQRVYVKGSVLELIDPTEVFLLKWEPKVNIELKAVNRDLKQPNHYEVTLEGTLKLSIADKEIGTLKVEQAGIFRIEGFAEEQKKMILNGHCQDLLYPYFCSQVARMTTDAGFPSLQLRPMSFALLYQQNVHKQEAGQQNKKADA